MVWHTGKIIESGASTGLFFLAVDQLIQLLYLFRHLLWNISSSCRAGGYRLLLHSAEFNSAKQLKSFSPV